MNPFSCMPYDECVKFFKNNQKIFTTQELAYITSLLIQIRSAHRALRLMVRSIEKWEDRTERDFSKEVYASGRQEISTAPNKILGLNIRG
jgi:hypothetical protein